MTRDGRAVSWLAFDGTEAAGTGTLIFWHRIPGPHSHTGKYAYIMNMYTRPEFRRRGIASTILSRLIETAKDAGLNRVALHSLPAAVEVYLKAGFVRTHNEMALRW
jgi:GNAT superfamily N-acetyltransferase